MQDSTHAFMIDVKHFQFPKIEESSDTNPSSTLSAKIDLLLG
jgi:hypothetical protein